MKRRFSYLLPTLVGAAMLITSCGAPKPASTPDLMDLVGLEGNRPRTFLADAEVKQAKSLAMGSAVSKGWKIADAADDRLLVVVRPLTTDAAEALAGEPIMRAAIEVRTNFDKRRKGVTVVAGAAMIADKMTDEGKTAAIRIDFTDRYKDELNFSLNALRRSWEEHRRRTAAAPPPLPTEDAAPKEEGTKATPATTADRKTATTARKTATTASPLPKEDAAAPTTASNTDTAAAPVADRPASTPPPAAPAAVSADSASGAAPPPDRMEEPGLWALYAEAYAEFQGCERSNNKTTLESKQLDLELHRVYCRNGRSFLIECKVGFCRMVEEKYTWFRELSEPFVE